MITEKVQNLFDFIDWLHSKVDYLLSQQHLVDELNEIRAEQNKLSPTKHFKDKVEYDRLQNLLLEKWPVVEAGIIAPIREKIEFYNIADISTPIINLNALGDLLELQRNYDEQDLLKIQKAKNQYIIYRIKTRWQPYFSFGLFFSDLDRDLYEYFKFFEEDNEVDFISDKTVKVENLEEAVQLLTGKTVHQNINFDSFTDFLEYYKKEAQNFKFDNRHSEVKRIIDKQNAKLSAATMQSEIDEVLQFAEKCVKELKDNLFNVFNKEHFKAKVIGSAPPFYNIVKALIEYEKIYNSAIFSHPDKKEAKSENSAANQQSEFSKLIRDNFNGLNSDGWRSLFLTEGDFISFVHILTNFFECKPYKIENLTINLKRNTKTKVAAILSDIHKDLSENQLRKDKEFFKIVRILNHFRDEEENDLYKALTR